MTVTSWRNEVALRGGLAAWVLGAHLLALLLPLGLVLLVARHRAYLGQVADYPDLLYLAAALFAVGSAFEVAQNTVDRWYLTPACGSAGGTGLCDLGFQFCITAGQAAVAVALGGQAAWVLALALAAVLLAPLAYLSRRAAFAPLGATAVLAALLAYRAFGDPVIFLQFAGTGLTLLCFNALLRTGAQALHGCTTLAAGSGVICLALALANGAAGRSWSWAAVAGTLLAAALLMRLAWPWLLRLPATPPPRSG